MIRVAATGDLHFGKDSAGTLRPHLEGIEDQADLLLIAGDLTKSGDPEEAEVLAGELRNLPIPTVTVLGNHDYHSGAEAGVRDRIERAGVRVLEGETEVVKADGMTVGIAGIKGFGGGFSGACATEFGEDEMKLFVHHTRLAAERLGEALSSIDAPARIALLHYSPVRGTLQGERLEIFPFLGSYLLAEPIDRVGANLVIHGHAHAGTEKGVTPGGVHVRNVAQPVIKHAFNVYHISEWTSSNDRPAADEEEQEEAPV